MYILKNRVIILLLMKQKLNKALIFFYPPTLKTQFVKSDFN